MSGKTWSSKPRDAWCNYIRPYLNTAGWLEDGDDISGEIKLSKRELFALIFIAYDLSAMGGKWRVGYDPADGKQQNDGHVKLGNKKLIVEAKMVAQMQEEEVLEAILKIYDKTLAKGADYGSNRILVIQPNKQSDHGGLIKISALRDHISGSSMFDRVLTMAATAFSEDKVTVYVHIIQHYPVGKKGSGGISQVDLNMATGEATVSHSGIDWSS